MVEEAGLADEEAILRERRGRRKVGNEGETGTYAALRGSAQCCLAGVSEPRVYDENKISAEKKTHHVSPCEQDLT